jgi:hypothetical protein
MAIFGWQTAKEAVRYTRGAEKKRLSAGATHLLARPNNEQILPTLDAQSDQVGKKAAKD